MASAYLRKDSPYYWIRFKDDKGKWQSKNSGRRRDNAGDKKQVKLLVHELTLAEMKARPVTSSEAWDAWGGAWMQATWGTKPLTLQKYKVAFWNLLDYFKLAGIPQPSALKREHVLGYFDWRTKKVSRNTAIQEIGFLRRWMREAVDRGYATSNPAANMRLETTPPQEKRTWEPEEVDRVLSEAEKRDKFGWMHVAFLMGHFQAIRLKQCAVPLSCIDFARRVITYPNSIVKRAKGYTQPIDPEFYPVLMELVEHRRKLGKSTLCEFPVSGELPASVQIRRFLDELRLPHLVHHGLRVSWVTRAALAGIPETLAKRFANHSSTEVHKVYQKITATDLAPMLDAFVLARKGTPRLAAEHIKS